MQWINVEDDLPKQDGRYLALVTFDFPVFVNGKKKKTDIPFVVKFKAEEKSWLNGIPDQKVTHWIEIPEPPSANQKEEIQTLQRPETPPSLKEWEEEILAQWGGDNRCMTNITKRI